MITVECGGGGEGRAGGEYTVDEKEIGNNWERSIFSARVLRGQLCEFARLFRWKYLWSTNRMGGRPIRRPVQELISGKG